MSEEEELCLLSSNPFERPADVRKEDLLSVVGSHADLRAEINELRAEINAKDSEAGGSILSDDESFSTTLVGDTSFTPPMSVINSNSVPKNLALTAKVEHLEEKWSKADTKLAELLQRINGVEQYGRLYNLLIHDIMGVPYKLKGLRFSAYVVRLLNRLLGKHLFCPIQLHDIDKSHPLYKKINGKYVIIVRFVRRDIRDAIFYKKDVLKETNTGITITENLTKDNMELLKSAEKSFGKGNVSSDQGKIYALLHGRRRHINNKDCITSLLSSTLTIPVDSRQPEPSVDTPAPSVSSPVTATNKPADGGASPHVQRVNRLAKNKQYLQQLQKFNNVKQFNGGKSNFGRPNTKNRKSNTFYNSNSNRQWRFAKNSFNNKPWHWSQNYNHRFPIYGHTDDYTYY